MKTKILTLFCVAILLPIYLSQELASTNSNVELIGKTQGLPAGIYKDGDYAYLCAGDSLAIIDVSDPQKPVKVGQINIAEGADKVYVEGNYARAI
jgi:hypothetical protein